MATNKKMCDCGGWGVGGDGLCGGRLEGAGWEVTLVEARGSLGGRASSYEDSQTGEELDNCQHVLLGCCTNLLDLYRRMGVEGKIHWERRVHFLEAGRGGGRMICGGCAGCRHR